WVSGCTQRNGFQGLAPVKSSIGTAEGCPLNLCRGVSAPTVTGASINEDARSLIENARARPRRTPNWRSPRHTVGINGHSSEIEERTLPLERASLRIER